MGAKKEEDKKAKEETDKTTKELHILTEKKKYFDFRGVDLPEEDQKKLDELQNKAKGPAEESKWEKFKKGMAERQEKKKKRKRKKLKKRLRKKKTKRRKKKPT